MSEENEKKYRLLKAKLGVTDEYFAELFKFTNVVTFRNSSARGRYVEAIISFYERVKEPLELL